MITPQQINQAIQNNRKPPCTHGAKVHDSLQHVQQSRNDKASGQLASSSPWADNHNAKEVGCDCKQV